MCTSIPVGRAGWYIAGIGDDTFLVCRPYLFLFVARESIVSGVCVEEEAIYDLGRI